MLVAAPIITDAELVGLALTGDGDAFHHLFERHRDRVTAVCRQRLRSSSDVDDAVQEAFARALASLRQLRDPERFGPWIRSIAVRACTDHHRAAARLVPVDDDQHGEAEDTAMSPEEMLLAAERNDALRATLAELGERDRQALWMRHVSEAPVAAVAMELGLTEGSTRVLLTRARHRLRAATTSLPALIPVSWRQWIRDHLPSTSPAIDALVVAVALTIAGTGSAGAADVVRRQINQEQPAAIAAAADERETAKAKDRHTAPGRRAESRKGGTSASASNSPRGRAVPVKQHADRGTLSRVTRSVQVRDEYPDEEETQEQVDLTVFTTPEKGNPQDNNVKVYGNEVESVLDAVDLP